MSEEETTVTVEHNDTETNDSPEVVVVAPTTEASDSGTDVAIGVAIGQLTAAVETINQRLESIEGRLTASETTAEVALDVAVEASQEVEEVVAEAEAIAEEAAEEVAEEAVEDADVIEPQREHPIWRNPIRLRKGHEGED